MYNCRKRQYYAKAVQLTPDNEAQVLAILNNGTTRTTIYEGQSRCLIVRFSAPTPGQRAVDTLNFGNWVVTGENGEVKCYSDKQFKIKYEEVHVE